MVGVGEGQPRQSLVASGVEEIEFREAMATGSQRAEFQTGGIYPEKKNAAEICTGTL